VYSVLYSLTEPVLGPVRRIIPPMGFGGMGLDLSPIVVFFGISVISGILCR
jgi:YggT family protein